MKIFLRLIFLFAFLWSAISINVVDDRVAQSREPSVGYFAQLTDIHLDPFLAEGNDVDTFCHNKTSKRDKKTGWVGDLDCYTSEKVLESVLDFLESPSTPSLDFIAWTGDQTPLNRKYPFKSDDLHVTQELINSIAHKVTEVIKSKITVPVFPCIGNHAIAHPSWLPNTSHKETRDLFAFLAGEWDSFLPTQTAKSTFAEKAGYAFRSDLGFWVLSVNSIWCDHYNLISYDGSNDKEMDWTFDLMKNTFKTARESGEKVLFLSHIPFDYQNMIVNCIDRFVDLVREYSDVIATQLYGHVHTDYWNTVRDSNGKPIATYYITPSVTPNDYHAVGHHPCVRIFSYNKTDFEILDYNQYYLNLTKANEVRKLVWEFQYSPLKDYGMNDLSPVEWARLSERMEDNANLFEKIYNNYNVLVPYYADGCDEFCKKKFICQTRCLTEQEALDCEA